MTSVIIEQVTCQKRLKKLTEVNIKETKRTFRQTQQFQQKLKDREAELIIANKIAEERKQSVIDHRVIEEVIWYYQESGTLKQYHWITPYYVSNILSYIRKWKHLSGIKDSDKMDFEVFAMCWGIEESNLNPKDIYCEEDGTKSWGMCKINDVCYKLFEGERWDNPESNIKAWMRWVKCRTDRGWTIVPRNKKVFWTAYWRLTRCKNG
jgi:hypothetical protein